MNLHQLAAFREVMRSSSISQAARKLGRTQPAVSLAIKNLEESLDCTLFERQGRRMIPVPEAYYLLSEASEILERLSSVSRTMKSLRDAEAGSLVVAAMPGPSTYLFPRFISDAIGDNPNIRVSMSSRSSPQIQELTRSQRIDFGFADRPHGDIQHDQYQAETISADCFCALSQDHPLAAQESVSVEDLDGEPMGSLYSDTTFFQQTNAAFAERGAEFNVRVDSFVFIPLLQFIGAGQCLAIVDPLAAVTDKEIAISGGKVTFRPIVPALRYEYQILSPMHRPLSQLAVKLREGWKEEVLKLLERIGANPKLSSG